MTHYSDSPGHVRVDFFKPSGKWYTTDMIDMSKWWIGSHDTAENQNKPRTAIVDAVKNALKEAGQSNRDMIAVVLAPYHEHEHPIMLMPGEY